MPEIVEVQVQVDGLQDIVGEVIQNVEFLGRANVLIDRHEVAFAKAMKGSRITNIFRVGKYIIMELRKVEKQSDEAQYLYLLTHLGMSGAYLINTDHKHVRIRFTLKDNELNYKDMRYFGNLKLFDADGLKKYLETRKLGVDALVKSRYEIEMQIVKKIYDKKYIEKPIKQLLLDQTILSGLGNIYVNEVLFASRIHPLKTPSAIGFADVKNMAANMKMILDLSYDVGGSSIKDYTGTGGEEGRFADHMKIYGRKGKPCFICDTTIEVVKVDGRSSFYCPSCQTL